ncbi:MAG: peptidoglycan DD-metalloendopeptidase family protein, partial [Azoarcus sp.]|nr:peptidoglycan DD-metalloendopeptidase family protein [Azoarcus sp.]
GFNNPEDVKAVQQLLQDKGFYKYDVDKRCGMLTIQAIKKFQEAYVIQTPDGLISPGRNTWKKLADPNPNPIRRTGPRANPSDLRLVPVAPAAGTTRTLPAGIRWPLERNIIRRGAESNTYGNVRSGGVHQGWDFQADTGTPCYAIGDGKVVYVVKNLSDDYIPRSFGNIVVIELNPSPLSAYPKLYAAYAHLKSGSIPVNAGDSVSAGQVIGQAGVSGNCKYMNAWRINGVPREDQHLHFEIRTRQPPGNQLDGRISPMEIFGVPPKHSPVISPLEGTA